MYKNNKKVLLMSYIVQPISGATMSFTNSSPLFIALKLFYSCIVITPFLCWTLTSFELSNGNSKLITKRPLMYVDMFYLVILSLEHSLFRLSSLLSVEYGIYIKSDDKYTYFTYFTDLKLSKNMPFKMILCTFGPRTQTSLMH